MDPRLGFPRELTDVELANLEFILRQEWDGAEQVRQMLRGTRALATWSCGCGSVDLSVSPTDEPLRSSSPVPAEGYAEIDEQPVSVMLFVDRAGAYLEFVWYVDNPGRLPQVHELRLSHPTEHEIGEGSWLRRLGRRWLN